MRKTIVHRQIIILNNFDFLPTKIDDKLDPITSNMSAHMMYDMIPLTKAKQKS